MKAEANFDTHNINKIKSQSVSRDSISRNSKLSQTKVPDIIQDLSTERNLISSVIVNQIAQNLIQNAILISTKLRDIASKGILTGELDQADLDDTLSGMKTSMEYLKNESTDIMQSVEKNMRAFNFIPSVPDLQVRTEMDIRKEINFISDFMNSAGTDQSPGLKSIDNIRDSLLYKESVVKEFLSDTVKKLNLNVEKTENFQLSQPDDIIKFINIHSDSALSSQGNIKREAVMRLL
jgi:hypothetical protein